MIYTPGGNKDGERRAAADRFWQWEWDRFLNTSKLHTIYLLMLEIYMDYSKGKDSYILEDTLNYFMTEQVYPYGITMEQTGD